MVRTPRESEAGGLLDAAPDAIIAVDTDGMITLVNAQCERLFGYRRDELLGRPVEMLVPFAARGLHPGHRARYLGDARPRPMGAGTQLAARRKDGVEFPADISLSSIDTADGLLVVAAVRDVTDRIRAEAKFRGLLEAAPDAIVGIASDGLITATAGTSCWAGGSRCWCPSTPGTCTRGTAPDTSPGPRRGRWAPACTWRPAVRTAPSSRSRSACPRSTPRTAWWCCPPSATSPTGCSGRRRRSG
jgi:PAS domain S-box-containing protein